MRTHLSSSIFQSYPNTIEEGRGSTSAARTPTSPCLERRRAEGGERVGGGASGASLASPRHVSAKDPRGPGLRRHIRASQGARWSERAAWGMDRHSRAAAVLGDGAGGDEALRRATAAPGTPLPPAVLKLVSRRRHLRSYRKRDPSFP
jgi:hypothetical protein